MADAALVRPWSGYSDVRARVEVAAFAVVIQAGWMVPVFVYPAHVRLSDYVMAYLVAVSGFAFLRGQRFSVPNWQWLAGLFVALWAVLALGLATHREFTSETTPWAIRRLIEWGMMGGYFLVGVALAQWARFFASAYVWICVAVCAVTYVLLVNYLFGGAHVLPLFTWDSRPLGLMDNPNALVRIVACAFLLCLWLWNGQRAWMLGLFLATIVLTGSRSGLAVLAAGLVVWIALTRIRPWPLALTGLYALVLLAPTLVAVTGGEDVVETPRPLGGYADGYVEHSVNRRWVQVEAGLELITEHPLRGIGLGSFPSWEAQHGYDTPTYLHNTLLGLWVETGPSGPMLFAGLWALLGWMLWRRRAERIAIYGLAVFGGFTALSLVHEIMYERYMWVFLGLSLAAAEAGPAAHPGTRT